MVRAVLDRVLSSGQATDKFSGWVLAAAGGFIGLQISVASTIAAHAPGLMLTVIIVTVVSLFIGAMVRLMVPAPFAVEHAILTIFCLIAVGLVLVKHRSNVSRLLHGGFRSVDCVRDACLVALIETGVPVWALDADLVDAAGLGIRTTAGPAPGARGDNPGPARGGLVVADPAPAPGSLVVADGSTVHAELFADPVPGHGVGARTRRVMLFSVAVDGVPAIHMDEALWCALEALGAGA